MSESSEKKKGFSTAYGGGTSRPTTNDTAVDYSSNSGGLSLSKHSGSRNRSKPDVADFSSETAEYIYSESSKAETAHSTPDTKTEVVSSVPIRKSEYRATWDREETVELASEDHKVTQAEEHSQRIDEWKDKISSALTEFAPEKKNNSVVVLTICACVATVLSFFLPLISLSFFVTVSQSGFDYAMSGEPTILICLLLSVVGLVCAIVAYKNAKIAAATIITSLLSMIVMFVALSTTKEFLRPIDYVASGFYVYMISHFAAMVLASVSLYLAKSRNA